MKFQKSKIKFQINIKYQFFKRLIEIFEYWDLFGICYLRFGIYKHKWERPHNEAWKLPGYNKKTNHFILPVQIRYVDNKQKLRGSDYARTKFLKRRIYGYFYNNLRINKTDKLTREELNDYYRNERIKKVTEYQKLMTKHGWTKADLARYLGVSHAWVTIVMRELE